MTLDFMHANHIGGAGGGYEPQRANQAQLIITGLDGQNSSRDDVLMLSVNNFSLPKVSSGIVEVAYLNEKRKFAGNPTYEDLSLTFNDYVDKQVAVVLWNWRKLVHDPVTGMTGLAASYKKTGYIKCYSPNGRIERQWRLEGCWIQNMDPGEIDYTSEETLKINMTLVIDKFYPEFAGIKP